MFWRQRHIRRAKQRVGARSENSYDVVAAFNRKLNLRTNRPADPIFLHGFDHFRPVQVISCLQNLIGIGRNAEKPLFEVTLGDGVTAAPTFAALNLLVS